MKNVKKAVALKYPQGVQAPIVMAKGIGKSAEKIIEEAEKNNVYVEENLELVNLLGVQEVGDIVPQEAWQALAAIFAFILEEK